MPTAKSSSKSSKTDVSLPRDSLGLIVVGKVLRAHGVRGHVLIATDPTVAEVLAAGADVFLTSAGGRKRMTITEVRTHPRGRLVGLEDIDDRDSADALRGMDVAVARSALPTPASGEYYDFELIGFEVTGVAGESLGAVVEVLETGANDVCVARSESGEVLVPMTEHAVIEIDRLGRRIVVEPGALLLEEEPPTAREPARQAQRRKR